MKIILFFIAFILSVNINAQQVTRNNVFAEASGATGIYSVNYERLLSKKRNINFALRGGIMYFPDIYPSGMAFPISISMIKQEKANHYLEIRISSANSFYIDQKYYGGLGNPSAYPPAEKKLKIWTQLSIGVGYRYQPEINGLFFNILLQKTLPFRDEKWYRYLSMGIGYAF